MITGEVKSQINGISNPMEVIEQMTYLLFIKRLDELPTVREKKANRLKRPIENPIFPKGKNPNSRQKRPYEVLRWSRFKGLGDPKEIYEIIYEEVKYDSPKKILKGLKTLELEIQLGMEKLEKMI